MGVGGINIAGNPRELEVVEFHTGPIFKHKYSVGIKKPDYSSRVPVPHRLNTELGLQVYLSSLYTAVLIG
jgi:hypothetical protein